MKWVLSLVGGMLLVAPAEAEFSCSMVGPMEAKVLVSGRILSPPVALADCEGARVVAGDITLCYLNRSERKVCRGVGKGQAVSRVGLDAAQGGWGGMFATVVALLKGDVDSGVAASRDVAGGQFPSGPVLGLTGKLHFDFGRAGVGKVDLFEVMERNSPGPVRLRLEPASAAVNVETAALERGVAYLWRARSGEWTLGGTFILAPEPVAEQMRASLDSLAAEQEAGRLGIALLQAEVMQDAGYAYEASEHLRQAGLAPAPH